MAVVAAHPDDEVLGCGGTIARHVAAGDSVHVLIMAEGVTSRSEVRNRDQVARDLTELGNCARMAHSVLGSTELLLLDCPDNRMDGLNLLEVVKKVEAFLDRVRAQVVYTHFPGDLNIDHRVVCDAVQAACRPLPGSGVESVFFFEVASSTEWRMPGSAPKFEPNYFVDISATLDLKLRALESYGSEMRPWPHARSVDASRDRARYRGASVGVDAAEAFVLGRQVLR